MKNRRGLSAALLGVVLALVTGCWDELVEQYPPSRDAGSDVTREDIVSTDGETVDGGEAGLSPDHQEIGDTPDVVTPPVDHQEADVIDVIVPPVDGPMITDTGNPPDRPDVVDVPMITDTGTADVRPPPDDRQDAGMSTDDHPEGPDVQDSGSSDQPDVREEDVPPPPLDVTCPTGLALCATGCINTQADPMNCGRCGGRCPTGIRCEAGACVDAVSIVPLISRRFYVESSAFAVGGGTDRSWPAFRNAPVAEYVDTTLTVTSSYFPSAGSGVVYRVGRVGVRFPAIVLPSGARFTALRAEFAPGAWANPIATVLVMVPFRPGRADTPEASDMAISHWDMSMSLGEAPNALWSDRMPHSIVANAAGVSYVARVATTPWWVGIVTHYDQTNTVPPMSAVSFAGQDIQPGSLRVYASYAP